MSINNIQLNPQLCRILFTNHLINEQLTIENAEIIENATIASLGGNSKKIIFLINNSENSFLSEEEMDMLNNLLTACKITMEDIALINYHQNVHLKYEELINQFTPKKVLIFGVTPAQLGLPFHVPFFQLQKFQQQIYFLSPSFENFLTDTALKKELWTGLKKLFLS